MRCDKEGRFILHDFQIIMEFLREAREKNLAQEQLDLAVSLGLLPRENDPWVSSTLFLEFRHELKKCHELFIRFDEDNSGYLETNEIWEALMSLGLMPKRQADKMVVMKLMEEASQSTSRTEWQSKRRFGGQHTLMFLYLSSQQAEAEEEANVASAKGEKTPNSGQD